jgi:glycosyltransferase involved in cell wall biosynthesis
MKIAYLSNSTIPSRTANSIQVMKMCQAFAKTGHTVQLITPRKSVDEEPDVGDVHSFYGVENCFEIIYIRYPPFRIFRFIFGFLAAMDAWKRRSDLVYGRDLVGCFFASLFKLPVIFESHGPIERKIFKVFFKCLIRRSSFKHLIVITRALADYYSESYPILIGKIVVAPDGADPVHENVKPEHFMNNNKKLQVGYVGHLYPGRGLEIIEQLAKRCPWADFHIIGGTENDINFYKDRMGDIENIFIQGYKQPKDVERYRLGCDVLLAPYQKIVSVTGRGNTVDWMSPLKVFEYMAAGKAIICSDLPVIREVLDNGRNAKLCPPEDVDEWERALVFLYSNSEIRKEIADNAKSDFNQHYSWQIRAKKILMNCGY